MTTQWVDLCALCAKFGACERASTRIVQCAEFQQPLPVLKHYHVLVGFAGLYMPDTNIAFHTLPEARKYAAEEVRQCREAYGTRWHGSVYRDGYATDGVHAVSITECQEPECWAELEGLIEPL